MNLNISQIISWLCLFYLTNSLSCDIKDQDKSSVAKTIEEAQEHELNKEVEIIGLLYHRFGEQKYPSTNISKELFRQQLAYLKLNDIKVITLSKAIEMLKSTKVKGRYIVISIDDAFKSFLNNGFPIIHEYGFEATLFINTETVGSGDYLGWEDLKYLNNHGIEIGNHTHSHDYFLDIDFSSRHQIFIDDVQLAQKIIKEKLNIEPEIFAYPYGEYDNEMKEELEKMGYCGAAAQNSGVISCYSDIYALPRFPMTDLYGKMQVFKEKINMKALPVVKTIPNSTIASENPPVLKIFLDNNNFQFDQMQCFIQGGNCKVIDLESENLFYQIISNERLTSRRHLYTITIPDKENKNWYWFSYQWVFPNTN